MKKGFSALLLMGCIVLIGCQNQSPEISIMPDENMTVENTLEPTSACTPKVEIPEQTASGTDDSAAIKTVVYEYFSLRHELRSVITDSPFDSQSETLLNLLALCHGEEFLNETLITSQMEYEQMQSRMLARGLDLSYASYKMRVEYNSIDINSPHAAVKALDEIKVRFVLDPEVESTAGDHHDLQLEKIDGVWKITDDQCDLAGYYSQRYEVYRSECPYEEQDRINEYIIKKFRDEVERGLQAG